MENIKAEGHPSVSTSEEHEAKADSELIFILLIVKCNAVSKLSQFQEVF